MSRELANILLIICTCSNFLMMWRSIEFEYICLFSSLKSCPSESRNKWQRAVRPSRPARPISYIYQANYNYTIQELGNSISAAANQKRQCIFITSYLDITFVWCWHIVMNYCPDICFVNAHAKCNGCNYNS